jgi:hypothetical protein
MEDTPRDGMAALVSGLTAAQAEMIAADLRDLQILAVVRESSRDCSSVLVADSQRETAARILDQIWPKQDRSGSPTS